MQPRQRVHLTYHACPSDEPYRRELERILGGLFDVCASRPGRIVEGLGRGGIAELARSLRERSLRDSTVTIVLIGPRTWQRRKVDWEIAASLEQASPEGPSGLVGLVLPSYRQAYPLLGPSAFNAHTVPPRLWDNVVNRRPYARIYDWCTDVEALAARVQTASLRRLEAPGPENRRALFHKNWPGDQWSERRAITASRESADPFPTCLGRVDREDGPLAPRVRPAPEVHLA